MPTLGYVMKIFMIVDDSPVIRRVANRILTDMGFSVVEAEDGAAALEIARREIPDAMLVDWDLGTMTGLEFMEEFNKIPGSHLAKTLYGTSEIMISDMTKAKRLGAIGFLMKPFNRKILIHKLVESGLIDREPEAA